MEPFLPAHAPTPRPRKALESDTACDVCVIGGGICGILTAHLLSARGLRVVVLEADRLLSGQTRGTTAKITVQHGLFAHKLLQEMGEARAQACVSANREALGALVTLCQDAGVDCSLSRQDAYLYATGSAAPIEQEAQAYRTLGLDGELVRSVPAPITVSAAMRMRGQAQFNPFPLLCALSVPLTVYEHTRALSLEGADVRTEKGTVRAKAVALCTHYPAFNIPGAYFARLYQERSYTLALRPGKDTPRVGGMLYGVSEGDVSLREADGCILMGGEGHRCGDAGTGEHYARLRETAARLFPGSREVAHWSAQDCMTMDSVPYVGRFRAGTPDVYVATGFCKWGMTGSMAAAQLLCDEIAGSGSPYAHVFSPQRMPGKAYALALMAQMGHTAADFSRNLAPALRGADALAPGEGAIVGEGLHKAAAYKDMAGRLHLISPYCAHMKCLLRFNPDETSWDCPCHGSRFSVDGKLLCGPAQHGLPRKS